ncbi:DUF6531 domain-containing protein [Microbacterium sp. 2P06AB]
MSAQAGAAPKINAPGVGVLPFYTFQDFPVFDRAVIRVNVANGNMFFAATDVTIAGPGQALQLDRYYNSLTGSGTTSGSFALGWGSSMAPYDYANSNSIRYADPTGLSAGDYISVATNALVSTVSVLLCAAAPGVGCVVASIVYGAVGNALGNAIGTAVDGGSEAEVQDAFLSGIGPGLSPGPCRPSPALPQVPSYDT